MKKSLTNLLKQLEESQVPSGDTNISSLNDALSKVLKKGGYEAHNEVCYGSTNEICDNAVCAGSSNNSCVNHSCII